MPFSNLTNLPLFSGRDSHNRWKKFWLYFYTLKSLCRYHSRRISALREIFDSGKPAPDISLYLKLCFIKLFWINFVSRIKSPAYKYQLIVNKIKYIFRLQIQCVVHICLLLKYQQQITNNSYWVFSFFLITWCVPTICQQITNRIITEINSYYSKSYMPINKLSTILLLLIK